MTYPSKSVVLQWQPDKLAEAATLIRRLADNEHGIRAATDGVVRAVAKPYDEGRWSRPARTAAEDRADSDTREISRVADTFDDLADVVEAASTALVPVVFDLRQAVTTLNQGLFKVGEDWAVTNMLVDREDQGERNEYALNETVRLRNLAETAQIIDNEVAGKIRANLGEYDVVAPAVSGLSGPQALTDITALLNGTALPEQIERFSAAATLTDEQIAQLARGGDTVLSVGQFDYLQSAMMALGDKDLSDILGLSNQHDGTSQTVAASVANGLQIASNPHVTSAQLSSLAPAMPGVAERGGLQMIPTSIRSLLTSPATEAYDDIGSRGRGVGTKIPRQDDLNSLAELLRTGDPELQQGTDVDRYLATRAGEIATATKDDWGHWNGDPIDLAHNPHQALQAMMDVVSNDHPVIHDAITGQNMPDGYNADQAVSSLIQYDWLGPDNEGDGRPINATFSWIGEDAHSPDQIVNQRAGESADGLARIMANHSSDMLDVPGAGDRGLGEVNPELTRTLADSLSPYLPGMVGVPEDMTMTHGLGVFRSSEVESLFAIFDTNRESALQFNGSAYAAIAQLNEAWGIAALDGNNRSEYAEWAGRLASGVDSGIHLELAERQADADNRARVDFANQQAHYDALKGIAAFPLKFLPISQIAGSVVDVAAPLTKVDIVGAVPDYATVEPRVPFTDDSTVSRQYHQALTAMLDTAETGTHRVSPDQFRFSAEYDDYFRPDGSLKDYDEIMLNDSPTNGPRFVRYFQDLSSRLGLPQTEFREQWEDGWNRY